MLKYILKRVLVGFVTLFALSTATFFLMKATPGSPINGERFKSQAARELAIKRYGLDKPVLEQYVMYLGNIAKGDLGESYIKEGVYVGETIKNTFPVTARLGSIAFVVALTVGITLGTCAALSKQRWINSLCMFIATIGVSVPSFLLAMFMIILFGVKLRLLPFVGLNSASNYILPVICLSMYPISMICRLTRSSMLEVMKQDYIILARSKGTPYKMVVIRHALKNAMLPVVTYAGPAFAFMLTGSFVIETVFSIPGIGKQFVTNISNRDYQMIMGLTIFLGALIITFNLITDIIAATIDPRIKLK
ncbi:MAG: ABC transporter permease [Holdemanella sp.]|nr:ABC transporter permease [Holdemanella sp.]